MKSRADIDYALNRVRAIEAGASLVTEKSYAPEQEERIKEKVGFFKNIISQFPDLGAYLLEVMPLLFVWAMEHLVTSGGKIVDVKVSKFWRIPLYIAMAVVLIKFIGDLVDIMNDELNDPEASALGRYLRRKLEK